MSVDHSDSRVTPQSLNRWQLAAYEQSLGLWEMRDQPKEDGRVGLGKCPAIWKKGLFAGRRCPSRSGRGIWPYEGLGGPCMAHGGAKKEGRALGGWLMAHKFAEELDVSPWEALLLVIRITAGRLRYIEGVLGSAADDRELEGRVDETEVTGVVVGGANDGAVTTGRNLTWWVEKSEQERDRLARVSKAAIDAGVAQLLIEKELRSGEELAGTFVKVLKSMEEAGMSDEALELARGVLRSELQLAIESA